MIAPEELDGLLIEADYAEQSGVNGGMVRLSPEFIRALVAAYRAEVDGRWAQEQSQRGAWLRADAAEALVWKVLAVFDRKEVPDHLYATACAIVRGGAT